MNAVAARLPARVAGIVAVATVATVTILLGLVPELVLLDPALGAELRDRELLLFLVAGVATLGVAPARFARHPHVLRALALGSRSVEAADLDALGREPGRLTRRWALPLVVAQALAAGPIRPAALDPETGVSVAALGVTLIAAAALGLYAFLRSAMLRALELAPEGAMRELVDAAARRRGAEARAERRLRTAVATPVALVALGATLLAAAHVRRAEQSAREGTARVVARAAMDREDAPLPDAGREAAIGRAALGGFGLRLLAAERPYSVHGGEAGVTVVTVPLDGAAATVRFASTTAPIAAPLSLLAAAAAVLAAAALGRGLGRAHTRDVEHATDGVRLLGTEAVLSGGRLPAGPPHFEDVEALEGAIERLAERFRVFAAAQERAILAREAATRTRGLFFASVSHDLKSPLNAVLGFTELLRREPLTPGQAESLDVIDRRGRQLLLLIETILDAARVEAGQLELVLEAVDTRALLDLASAKAREFADTRDPVVWVQSAAGPPALAVDRIRLGRALATLVAAVLHRAGTAEVRTSIAGDGSVDVTIAGRSARDRPVFERWLAAASRGGAATERGLVLALSLADSIVRLHGGTLDARALADGRGAYRVRLPPAARLDQRIDARISSA